MNTLHLPRKVYFKSGCMPVALRELSEVYHLHRAFLVTDAKLYRAGVAAPVQDRLMKQGIRTAEFFAPAGMPGYDTVRSARAKLLEFEPDVIVGIGGEGVMNAAKALWLQYENPETDPADFAETALAVGRKAKLVLVAADFSAGGQNSPFVTLRDAAGALQVLRDVRLVPEISVTDAQFTEYMTAEQVRGSGLALLALAIRAYADPGCNEYTQGLTREAAAAVLKYLKFAEDGCPVAREKLANAAALAGAAFGSIFEALDPCPAAFPAEGETANPRIGLLAQALGYTGADALAEAVRAL